MSTTIDQGLAQIAAEYETSGPPEDLSARRHPHDGRKPAGRADRPGGRAAAHRALAQRSGRDRLPAVGARRDRRGRSPGSTRSSARLLARAEEHAATMMPGFTHLQVAQPVTLGHHLMACYEMVAARPLALRRCARADERMRRSAAPRWPAPASRSTAQATAARARLRRADRQFARFGLRPRFRARLSDGGDPVRAASVAPGRGVRDLGEPAVRLRLAARRLFDRLVDHAAEAQSRRGRAGARPFAGGSRAAWSR